MILYNKNTSRNTILIIECTVIGENNIVMTIFLIISNKDNKFSQLIARSSPVKRDQ